MGSCAAQSVLQLPMFKKDSNSKTHSELGTISIVRHRK
jgi:hypothetical protein